VDFLYTRVLRRKRRKVGRHVFTSFFFFISSFGDGRAWERGFWRMKGVRRVLYMYLYIEERWQRRNGKCKYQDQHLLAQFVYIFFSASLSTSEVYSRITSSRYHRHKREKSSPTDYASGNRTQEITIRHNARVLGRRYLSGDSLIHYIELYKYTKTKKYLLRRVYD